MDKLGAGVIGLRMGGEHLYAYANHPEVEVKGICDTDEEKLKELAEKYNVKFITQDYKELLDKKDIDIVSVATPDYLHAEQSIAALKSGKHVLCEKPMVPTLEDCQTIIEAAEKSECKFMVGQICRFAPGFQMTKKLIDEGRIGELFYVESEYAHDYRKVGGVGGWRKDPVKIREPFLGGGCHAVDLVRWIAGDVEETFAYANHRVLTDWPVDDCTIAAFKFKSGVIGKVFVSIGCKRPYTMRSVFYGSKGTIISDNTTSHIKIYDTGMEKLEFVDIPVDIASHNVRAEVNEFIDCIRGRNPLLMDAREGARTVATCLAAVESSKSGIMCQVLTYDK